MIILLAKTVLSTLSNAVGLAMAAILLDDFSINVSSFIVAVLIFSVSTTVLGPLIYKIALTNARYLVGGIALITTLVGLFVTNLLTDGLVIESLPTWAFATLIIWVFSIIGSLLLPLVIFKKTIAKVKDKDNNKPQDIL